MLVRGSAGHEDVIEVDKNEIQIPKYVIYKTLKRLSGVSQTKGHTKIFIEAERSDDCGLVDVLRRYRNLMIRLDQIQLGKDHGAMKENGAVVNVW